MKTCLFLFVWVEALSHRKQIFSHVGTEPPLPGYYQYLIEAALTNTRNLCFRAKIRNKMFTPVKPHSECVLRDLNL